MEALRGIGVTESRAFVRRPLVAVRVCLLSVAVAVAPTVAAADTIACGMNMATQAEAAIDSVDNWQKLFEHFHAYGRCDDGALAEAYSDRVAALLATQWASIRKLDRLVKGNAAFRIFVLRHVDSLMSPEQARTIAESAKRRCPKVAKALCADLALAVNDSP